MYHRKPAPVSALDETIADLLSELKGHEATSNEYVKVVDQLTKLYALKSEKTDRVSKDTLVLVLGNLAGILVIVGYEQKAVITSKATGFIKSLL